MTPPTRVKRQWWAAILVAGVAILAPLAIAITSGVSFTINGYDVDEGTDPICWRLAWWPASQFLELQNFKMMPACYNGTSLKVTPLNFVSVGHIRLSCLCGSIC